MSEAINETIKSIISAEAAKPPREPYLNVVGKDTRGVLSIIQFFQKPTMNSGEALFPQFRIDEVRAAREGAVLPAVGTKVSNPFMINSTKNQWSKTYARKDAKAFLLAALGAQESEVSSEDLGETLGSALSSDQPLRGLKVGFETYTKNNSNMVLVRFYHVPGQTPESTKANRAFLDKDYPVAK